MKLTAWLVMVTVLTVPCLAAADAEAQQMVVSADRASGVYGVGDTVRWTVEWKGDAPAPAARYMLKSGGLKEVGGGELTFDGQRRDGRIEVRRAEHDAARGDVGAGEAVEPRVRRRRRRAGSDQARRAAARRFRRVLEGEARRAREGPAQSEARRRATRGKPGVDYWKITLDNIRGTHVNGQLARPEKRREVSRAADRPVGRRLSAAEGLGRPTAPPRGGWR